MVEWIQGEMNFVPRDSPLPRVEIRIVALVYNVTMKIHLQLSAHDRE